MHKVSRESCASYSDGWRSVDRKYPQSESRLVKKIFSPATKDQTTDLQRNKRLHFPDILDPMDIVPNPESAMDLSWNHKLAVFWSIAWPSWLASLLLIALVSGGYSVGENDRPTYSVERRRECRILTRSGDSHAATCSQEISLFSSVRTA
jgi:hypothetical protein